MQSKYGPSETHGRDFKGEGFSWVFLSSPGRQMYCKIDDNSKDAILRRLPLMVWHPLGITPQGLAYLSASAKTLEPWILVNYDMASFVHPDEATNLDQLVKEKVSTILEVTENQMPKGPIGIIRD